MSTHAASAPISLPTTMAASGAPNATKALTIGLAGIGVTALGLLVSGVAKVATSWLIGLTFWTGIALGALFLIMIHHILDAGWSVVLRRQYEHFISAFPWLGLLFLPLIIGSWIQPDLVWKWMNPAYDLAAVGGHGTVGEDVLYVKKSAFLNLNMFTGGTIAFFLAWTWLSSRLRKASFAQDADGDLKWTYMNRKTAAFGLPIAAITLTAGIIFWVKSLEYHWFSTMYGVWYFAGCVRAALSLGVILLIWLWKRGDLKGILNDNHLHSIGQLMFAFTVFWAYVTFSQYFLIWNANVPEETFWYNLREDGQWLWVGMFLLFGHFFAPFLTLIHYPVKISKTWLPRVAVFIAFVFLIDLCYNVMPAKKFVAGEGVAPELVGLPLPFLQLGLVWTISAVIGIGGICVWAYLRSFPTTKLIPIRDPRITESLTYHEPHAS